MKLQAESSNQDGPEIQADLREEFEQFKRKGIQLERESGRTSIIRKTQNPPSTGIMRGILKP